MSKIKKTQSFRYNHRVLKSAKEADEFEGALIHTILYDENGNILKSFSYDEKGNIEQIVANRYNANGNLIEEQICFSEDEIAEKLMLEWDNEGRLLIGKKEYAEGGIAETIYQYNKDGQLIEKITKDGDDEIEEIQRFQYENKNLVEKAVLSGDEDTLSRYAVKYDGDGNVIEEQSQEEDGSFSKIVNEFDEKGKLIVQWFYDNENDENPYEKRTYIYNDDGKLKEIGTESKKNGIQINKMEYDERGNIVKQETYNQFGQLIHCVNEQFDSYNNKVLTSVYIPNDETGYYPSYTIVHEHEYYPS